MNIATYQTTPEKHGNGTYFFTDCGHKMFSINNNNRQYHGCLCPDCLYKGIQTTLYIRGSEEANKYWDEKLNRSEISYGGFMDKLKLYTVTKSSSDGTFEVGDIIWLSDNGDLNSAMGGGWLSEEEWNVDGTNDFEVEECTTHHLLVLDRHEMVLKNES